MINQPEVYCLSIYLPPIAMRAVERVMVITGRDWLPDVLFDAMDYELACEKQLPLPRENCAPYDSGSIAWVTPAADVVIGRTIELKFVGEARDRLLARFDLCDSGLRWTKNAIENYVFMKNYPDIPFWKSPHRSPPRAAL